MDAFDFLPDSELWHRMKTGEEAAFRAIFDRHWQPLFERANYILDNRAAAEDIVQDVFFSIWTRRQELEMQSVKAYLEQATRFQVFKALRDRKAGQRFQQRLSEVTADILTDDPMLFREHQQLLDYLISRLPEDCREPFRLSRQEELSYKEIADMLHISERAVKHRIARSLSFLRTHYNYQWGFVVWVAIRIV